MCLLLAACGASKTGQDTGPVAWWHNLEGGPIAAQRPPPPNANAPWPNLSTVPPKPVPIDPASRTVTYDTLAADRANATYEANQDPLAAAPARDSNGLFAPAAPLPAASPDAAGAALEAATPPPSSAATAPKAGAAGAAPASATTARSGTGAGPVPTSPADVPIPDIVADNTPPPPVPDAPPPPPVLAGVTIPVTKPVLPPRQPPPKPAVPGALTAAEAAPVSFAFAPRFRHPGAQPADRDPPAGVPPVAPVTSRLSASASRPARTRNPNTPA